jgi:DNA polymerase III epsilon subunit-like protein
MKKYELFVLDTETTGLDPIKNEPVEISIHRLSNNSQKTWCLKPINFDHISQDALRVNGLKIEDLRGDTKEGREKYRDPAKVIIEIENWLSEDLISSTDRILAGQVIQFDKTMLEHLWIKCNSGETFPFNRKYTIDTAMIEFFTDYCKNEFAEGYSLHALTKKYGIKNKQAHSAEEDVKATVGVLNKQVEFFHKILNR